MLRMWMRSWRSSALEKRSEQGRLSPDRIREFRENVYRFYRAHGRDLPWRRTEDPYCILVSEVMLQQTQVERICGRYERFLVRFPDFATLAGAQQWEVLREWQGLGYNRRALALHRTAGIIASEYGGVLPCDEGALFTLPGIGRTTAASLVAFAYNRPAIIVETNIRRVFIHCFFPGQEVVSDREIIPLVAATCDRDNPRDWYYALMDLGSSFKTRFPNPNRRSTQYHKQSSFEGSDRMIRGKIISLLLDEPGLPEPQIYSRVGGGRPRIGKIITALEREGFLEREGGLLTLR